MFPGMKRGQVIELPIDALRRGAQEAKSGARGESQPSRFYLWGRANGASDAPEFVAALLALPGGVGLAERTRLALTRLPRSLALPAPDQGGVLALERMAHAWDTLAAAREREPGLRLALDRLISRSALAPHLPRLLERLAALAAQGTPLCPLRETLSRLASAFAVSHDWLTPLLLDLLDGRWWSLWGRPSLPRTARRVEGWEEKRWKESVEPLIVALRRTRMLGLTLRLERSQALEHVPKTRTLARRYAALVARLDPGCRTTSPEILQTLRRVLETSPQPGQTARALHAFYGALDGGKNHPEAIAKLTRRFLWNRCEAEVLRLALLIGPLKALPDARLSEIVETVLSAEALTDPASVPALQAILAGFAAWPESLDSLQQILQLALSLSASDPAGAATLSARLLDLPAPRVSWEAQQGAALLARYPALAHMALVALRERPQGALALLAEPEQADKLPEGEREALAAIPACALNHAAWAWTFSLVPEAEPLAYELAALGVARPAPGVQKAARLAERLETEACYLAKTGASPARLKNIQARLSRPDDLLASIRAEVLERLGAALIEAALGGLRGALDALWQARLARLGSPAGDSLTEDIRHAARFSLVAGKNRRALVRLLRGEDLTRHAANVRFEGQVRALGIHWDEWRAARPQVHGGLRVEAEIDPREVLWMGTRFGTCLGVDGCNAFSAIANAVDVNKRVLWVRDAHGELVARQLIALDLTGNLVGFSVYHRSEKVTWERCKEVLTLWARSHALACGATLANEGEVPRLLSRDWYDDGICAWPAAAA